MKLIYIHQHFVTNEGTSGTRSYDVSKHLVQKGHNVTMVCGICDQSSFSSQPWWRLFHVHYIDGIKVVVCNSVYGNKMSVFRRMWSFMKFAGLALTTCLFEPSPDLIFATSTPLTVGIPGRIGAAVRRIPYIFEVRDLWPEDWVAAGQVKPGLFYKCWEWLEAFSYAKAKKILTVSTGFHERLLERGFAPERLATVALGADGKLFNNLKPDDDFISDLGLSGKTIAVYAGAHGDANGLHQIIEASEYLRDRPDIAIMLIGDGKLKRQLKLSAVEKDLTNIYFPDPVPKHRLPDILTSCHMGLMILKQISRPWFVTPNKLFDYMFTGIPTIVNFPGTTAQLVEREGIGLVSLPGSAEDLASKIQYLADHPEEREMAGRRARQVAVLKYDRKIIAEELETIFRACLQS
ncbi:glycosyltransferase family 4 protein [Acidobacteriota bacterium]